MIWGRRFRPGHGWRRRRRFADNRVESDPPIHSAFVQFGNGVRGYFLSTIGDDWEVTGSAGKLRALNDGSAIELRRPMGPWKQLQIVDAPPLPNASSALACLEDLVEAIETVEHERQRSARAAQPGDHHGHHRLARAQRRARANTVIAVRLYVGKQDWRLA